MKSSLLLTLLITAMTASVASAQMSTRANPKDMLPQKKTTFDKFYDRLKISYSAVFTSPNLDDIANSHWENAAISPEWDSEGDSGKNAGKNRDTWPVNLWHQISFNYNFGAKMTFVFNPRFATPLAHPTDMKAPEDRSFIMLEDFFTGFQGVLLSSDDKKFNFWARVGLRLPTSRATRNTSNGGAGSTTHQTDASYNFTYDFNKTFQVSLYGQFRQWVIEDQYGFDRFRIYTAPNFTVTLNDTTKIVTYYENFIETDRRSKPADDRDPVFKDKWQNVMVGVSKDVTSKLNVYPYVATFINDTPITDKSVWFGAWISYAIK